MRFTDERLYVLGIGTGYMTDLKTGDFLYWSDKMQEANVSVSASDNELRAGLGNGPAIIVPTEPNITVTVTAAEYSEYVKAASVGAAIIQGAPVMVCREVTAEGTNLAVDLSGGTPVAGLGMDKAVCYVQEVGEESPVYSGGTAYELDASTGAVEGFTAESGKQYAVNYFVTQANATLTTVTSNIRGKVVRFVFSQPVYTGCDHAANSGDFWGWLHTVVPRLQLMPSGGGTDGSQTAFTVSGITGRAVAQDAVVITEECGDCGFTGLPLMYRILQPCDSRGGVDGIIGVIGANMELLVGESRQIEPAVIQNGILKRNLPPSAFQYSSSDTNVATVGYGTGIVTGEADGTAQIAVFYHDAKTDMVYTDVFDTEVVSEDTSTKAYLTLTSNLTQKLYFMQSEADGVIVDWGDGSTPETFAGSAVVGTTYLAVQASHTYANAGNYVIRLTASDGVTWQPGNGYAAPLSGYGFLGASIGKAAGNTPELTAFVFGAGCKAGASMFGGCSSLQTVQIPEDTTTIGACAFYNCTGLISLTIPSSVTYISTSTFSGCVSLTNIVLPNGLTNIGNGAFYGCSSLTSIVIPSGVTSIADQTFQNCTNLESVTIPSGMTQIGTTAFASCVSLDNLVLPNGLTSIGDSAFSGCTSLTSVTIPSSVTSIGSRAFNRCSALTALTVSISNQNYKSVDNVLFSKDGTQLIACAGGKTGNFAVPSETVEIVSYAFSDCSGITGVTFPNGLETIGDYAFYDCSGITNITFPNSLETIGEYAFRGTGLVEVTIPETVNSISTGAFAACHSLIHAEVGANSLGYQLFSTCDLLEKVWLLQNVSAVAVNWNTSTNKPSNTPCWNMPSTAVVYVYVDTISFVGEHTAYFNYYNANNGLPIVYSQRTRPW